MIDDAIHLYGSLYIDTMTPDVCEAKPKLVSTRKSLFKMFNGTHARTHAPAVITAARSSGVTIIYNTVIVLSVFRQVVLPDCGWEADRYEGDVEANKAITCWLHGGDFT